MATATRKTASKDTPLPVRPVKLGTIINDRFMGIRFEEWPLNGRHCTIEGPNASTKSTHIYSILSTFGLVTKRDLPEPIMRGETEGSSEVELIDAETGKTQLVVKRHYVEGKESRMTVRRPDGELEKSPGDVIAQYIDKYSITPFVWLANREQDQVDDVLRICNIAIPMAEVEAITGRKHVPLDGESAAQYLNRLSADGSGTYYVERTMAGRTWEQKKKALAEQRERVEALGDPVILDCGDIAELQKKRQALDEKREQRRTLQQNAATIKGELEQNEATLAGLPHDLERARAQASATEAEIARLQARLVKEREAAAALEARINKGKVIVAEIRAEWEAADEAAKALPDPTPQINAIDEQIRTISQRQEAIARRKVVLDEFERLRQEEADAAKEHARGELTLQQLRDLRRNLLNGADLGVTGLEIGDGELRFNGVPFRQASQAQRITVAFAIAIKRNPNARFMCLDDGEHLDKHSSEVLYMLCERHDVQLIKTCVSNAEELVITYKA